MTSGRVRAPALALHKELLDPRYPVGELVEVTAQRCECCLWRRLIPVLAGGGRAVRDEHSAALVGLHEMLIAQDAEGVVDGHGRDTVPAGQLPAGWQPFTRLERPVRDACAQMVGHLQVGRPRVVRVGLHPSRVSRPSCLERTTGALGGCLRYGSRLGCYISL